MSTTTDTGDAGRQGSIIPGNPGPGMLPPAPDPTDEYPINARVERDPSNLGDEVRDEGDLVYPSTEPTTNNI